MLLVESSNGPLGSKLNSIIVAPCQEFLSQVRSMLRPFAVAVRLLGAGGRGPVAAGVTTEISAE